MHPPLHIRLELDQSGMFDKFAPKQLHGASQTVIARKKSPYNFSSPVMVDDDEAMC